MALKLPGFVDLQVNGYIGIDFSNPGLTRDDVFRACKAVIEKGTVVFLPTVITSSESVFKRNLGLISDAIRHEDLKSHIPGIHIEGPFISGKEGAVGAHNPEWVKKPDISFLEKLIEWSDGLVKLITIAAEPDGADELCKYATSRGITVSLGHHLAGDKEINRLADSGARSLTHLGNGVPQTIDRHYNPIWAGLANENLTAMVITDGHHLPVSVLKSFILAKGAARIVVVSDASPIAGLPAGRYQTLGNEVLLEENGRLFNPETGYLVGSSSNMMQCMRFLASLNLLTDDELVDVGFKNPLRLIGLDPDQILGVHPSHEISL
jgi:N-acetylglucosamine-6-phosphate deacetylase